MARSAAALLAATLDGRGVHFTAWRRLDEMPAYAVAR
jgi:hypothetical protein